MMRTMGRIESIADGVAQVRVDAISACGSCRSKAGCATGAAAAATRLVRMAVPGTMRPGDEVALIMESGAVAGGALLGYLLPALCVLSGAIAGSLLYATDVASAVGAGIGLLLGLLALRLGSRILFRKNVHPSVCHPAHDSPFGDSA